MAKEWKATCKDCGKEFRYSDYSLNQDDKRGGSRPERCPACRGLRKREIDASGAGYFPIKIVSDEPLRAGIFGHVDHGERTHQAVELPSNVSKFEFGIKEDNIRQVYQAFDQEGFKIAIIEGPTGSGKSTYLPYRLIEAPPGVRTPDLFTRDGQIIVTQPRILPTSGISKFISESLNGSSVGQGADVGYKFSGSAETDRRNRLVFVTDGTLINWIKNDQLNHISVIMIDEAHERSKNIDLILMLLRANLAKFPKLKLIIASATIKAEDFIAYYGGSAKVRHLQFEGIQHPVVENFSTTRIVNYDDLLKQASKQIDENISATVTTKAMEVIRLVEKGDHTVKGDLLAFLHSENGVDLAVQKIQKALEGEKLTGIDVFPLYRNLPRHEQEKALERKVKVITNKIVKILLTLNSRHIPLLVGVLLDTKNATEAAQNLQDALAALPKLPPVRVFTVPGSEDLEKIKLSTAREERVVLLTSYEYLPEVIRSIPGVKVIEDRRIIVATNVAETSLTVDGTVHVIDSGLIKQNVFDPQARTQRLISTTHSQAGCKQRRGRAGRIRPGFAHYLYTAEQFEKFEPFTPPESQRSSLEDLLLQAKAAGIGDINTFAWFNPTEAMLKEVSNSSQALMTRGALDAEGEITELGLDMLSMTLDPLVANLLLRSDQFCCAIEAATLLAFLTLSAPTSSIFLWNRSWDSQTRWEVKKRQRAFFQDCGDDFELVLRTISAWEKAGSQPMRRKSWARQVYVDHEFIQNRLFPERDKLIELLSSGLRGKALRPVIPGLLDRLRFVAALAVKDQVSHKGQDLIGQDSICWESPPEKYIYLRKTPFKIANSDQRSYQVSLIGKVRDEWTTMGVDSNTPFTEYLPHLHAVSQRNETGKLLLNRAELWSQAAMFAPGSSYEGLLTTGLNEFIVHGQAAPSSPILEVGGWGKGLDLEIDYPIEEEISEDRAPDSAGQEIIEDPEEEFSVSPQMESSISIYFSEIPAEVKRVSVTSDEGWSFENVNLDDGRSIQLHLPPGEFHLHIQLLPADNIPCILQAQIYILVEEGINYLAVLGRWRGKYPAGVFIIEDRRPEIKKGKAALRWLRLGWKNNEIEVLINKKDRSAEGYYNFDQGSAMIEVYRLGESRQKKNPLGVFYTVLKADTEYTLLIHHTLGRIPTPQFELIEGSITADKAASENIFSLPVRFVLNDETTGLVTPAITQRVIVERCEPQDNSLVVTVAPLVEKDIFGEFISSHQAGEMVKVKPVAVDLYPNGNENALIVRDLVSGLEIAVSARDLFFDSTQSACLLGDFLKLPFLELKLESVNHRHKRVVLTRLDILAEAVSERMEKDKSLQFDAILVQVEQKGYPCGLVVSIDLGDDIFFPGMVWEQSLIRSTTRPLGDFQPGEKIKVSAKFTGGQLKNARLHKEQIELLRNSPIGRELLISENGTNYQVRLNRRMEIEELDDLYSIDDQSDFIWMSQELFRRSNQPRLDYIDEIHLSAIHKEYPQGKIVEARILQAREKYLEVMIADGIYGTISVSEWSNGFVPSLSTQARPGDLIRACVISIKENGHLALSRLRAAINMYQEGGVYTGNILSIQPGFLIISLVQDAISGKDLPGLSARIWQKQALLTFSESEIQTSLSDLFKVNERRTVRILKINRERNQIDATISKVFQAKATIPKNSTGRFAALIGAGRKNIQQIQASSCCEVLTQRSQQDGPVYLFFSAETRENIESARSAVQKIIPDLQWDGYV